MLEINMRITLLLVNLFILVYITGQTEPPCDLLEFLCDSGECIRGSNECDRHLDCSDYSDELPINTNCPPCENVAEAKRATPSEFLCDNGECIRANSECDRNLDCSDYSDEQPINTNCSPCDPMAFQCDNGECIWGGLVCDRDPDCSDYSDELPINTNCPPCDNGGDLPEFLCDNGECIWGTGECDRNLDCSDYSDELPINTNCPPCDNVPGPNGGDPPEFLCDNGECIVSFLVFGECDRNLDCSDYSDELPINTNCPPCDNGAGANDPPEFLCDNGECAVGYECDRELACSDYSDEFPINKNCTPCDPLDFLCDNGECILGACECNRYQDCSDYSDELPINTNCPCGRGCIEENRCNGITECRDEIGSDEIFCEDSFSFIADSSSPNDIDVTWNETCQWGFKHGYDYPFCYSIDIKVEVFLNNQDGCMPTDGFGNKIAEIIEPSLCSSDNYYYYYDDYQDEYIFATCNYTISALEPHSTYKVKVTPGTTLCLPVPSQSQVVTTLENAPSTGPISLAVTNITPTSLSFSWEPAACGDRNGDIQGYVYQLRLCLGGRDCDTVVGLTFTDSKSAYIDGLDCNTEYTFIVSHGDFVDGEIGPATEVTERTFLPGPNPLVNSDSTPTSLSFTWESADCWDGAGYVYSLCEGTVGANCNVPVVGPTFTANNSVVISNLRCNTDFTFTVTHGFQEGLDIEMEGLSSELTVRTSTPAPSSLINQEATPSSLSFTWGAADCWDGTGYVYRLCEGTVGDTCEDPEVGPSFTDESKATIDNLACDTECTFIIRHGRKEAEASGSISKFGLSSKLTVWTSTTAPTSITSTQSTTSLTLSWLPLNCGSTNPATFLYILCPAEFSIIDGVCEIPTSNRRKRSQTTMMSNQTSSTSVSFDNIPCSETFTFMLAGVSGNGMIGEWSNPYEVSADGSGTVNDVTITNVPNGVEVSWLPPNIGCSISEYLIQYSLVKQDQCMDIDNPVIVDYGIVTEAPVTITSFVPHSSYHIYVTAVGSSGQPQGTTLHTVSATVPPVAPQDVRNTERTATTLSFEWVPIPCGERHGIISGYYCRLIIASSGEIVREFRLNQPDSPKTTVFGLLPLVQYGFSVAADIKYGDNFTGPYSDVVLATTLSMATAASVGNDGNMFTASQNSAYVYITRPSYSVNEDADFVSIIIQQTPGRLLSTDVAVRTIADTALAGVDFESQDIVITHIPYEVIVPIIADELYEGNEYFYLQIAGPSVSGISLTTITIIDDDAEQPVPTAPPVLLPPRPATFKFDKEFYYVSERGDGILPISVIRSGNHETTASFRVKSSGTTAFHPQDYQQVDEPIVFSPGQTSVSLEVMIEYDTIPEGPETFVLRLWDNSNLRLLDQSQVTITEGIDENVAGSTEGNQGPCPSETLATPYGNVILQSGEIDKVRNSRLVCPITTENAGSSVVTAVCVFEENLAYWDWKINCGQDFDADEALEQLAQDPVSEENVMEILTATEDLTSREVGVKGVSITAHIVEATVELGSSDQGVTASLVKITDNLMNLNPQTLFDANQQNAAPTRTVSAMETQLQHVELSVFEAYRQIEKNIAVEIIMADLETFQNGLGVASYDRARTRHKDRTDLTIIDGSQLPSESPPEAALYLPQDIVEANDDDLRVTFTVLSTNDILPSSMLAEMYNEDNTGYSRDVNSRVISAIVGSEDGKVLKTPAIITFKPLARRANNTECVFWDFNINDWSTEGCRSLGVSTDGLQQCECDHLTNFAVLMDIYGQTTLTKTQDYILEILSYVGCCLSVLGLIVSIITYASSKTLRVKNPNKILMNLCAALAGLYLVFIAMISVDTERGESEVPGIGCGVLAGLLHYFTLASLCWMAVEGANMYLMFVRVVNSYIRSLLLKASLFGWGLPALIVVITGAAARTAYQRTDFCFLQTLPLVGGVLVPIGLIMIFNIVVFVLIMRSLLNRTPVSMAQKKRRDARFRRVRNAAMITLLLGLTWALGFLGLIQAATFFSQLLFCVVNSMQGYLIFMMYCVQQAEVRNHWRRLFNTTNTGMDSKGPSNARGSSSTQK